MPEEKYESKEVDSEIKRLTEEGFAFFFVQDPGMAARFNFTGSRHSVAHAAETNAGNFESGLAKINIVHCSSIEARCGSGQEGVFQ